jgi:menaquinone-dependent protoporphyrinogen oxidase
MKTLIVFATRHGSSEKCSRLLKERLQGEVVTADLKRGKVPDITPFDKIIIGGSIHVGKIQKSVSEFCQQNVEGLKGKKLGLYICCMNKNDEITQLNSAFPRLLLNTALVKECFGGEFVFGRMNMLEKFAVKMVSKSQGNVITDTKKDISMLSEDKINKFAQVMNRA